MTTRIVFFFLLVPAMGCMGDLTETDDGGRRPISDAGAESAAPDAIAPADTGRALDGQVDASPDATVRLSARVLGEASRINVGVPLPLGLLRDPERVRVRDEGLELAVYSRALAFWPDGSLRSVQVQVEAEAPTELEIILGEASGERLEPVSVESLSEAGVPRALVLLDAAWLSASGVAGPMMDEASLPANLAGAWDEICRYDRFDADAFEASRDTASVWLFDRVTSLFRGYVRTGDEGVYRSALREAELYRSSIRGTGSETRIGVRDTDLKYHYTQGLALHYLMTGDDRFREAAEDVATRVSSLWRSPGYAGGDDFWTERHAGFALLAYVWAAMVSDDRADEFLALADDAVNAYLDIQATYPEGYTSTTARCFAHHATAHGEGYGYFGCSPWMSAILADGMHAYAALTNDAQSTRVHRSLVQLGRAIAQYGRDPEGKPFYFMGIGSERAERDSYDEHWGESAYIVAMAWHLDGRRDEALESAAYALVDGMRENGRAPHMRSFNWQCRSAVATPAFLVGDAP